MRMWMVPPHLMCRQHLLGEHLEIHMFVGHIKLGRKVSGYVEAGLLETASLHSRHEALVVEMKRRGYKHASPLRFDPPIALIGKVDASASLSELAKRCEQCRELQLAAFAGESS